MSQSKSLSLAKDFLNQVVTVTIDRQVGSTHPKHGFVYKVNYGYIPDTTAPDGEELDAYILGVTDPIEEFEGTCIAIVHRKNDDDDKLIVVPSGTNLTDEEINNLINFQEQWFESEIIRA